MSSDVVMKFCVGCRWFHWLAGDARQGLPKWVTDSADCGHEKARVVNLVTGEVRHRYCWEMRDGIGIQPGVCGKDGVYWEPPVG